MGQARRNVTALEAKVSELEATVGSYKAENKKLADLQQKLGEVTNNYLMLHYLNKNIQNCHTSAKLWKTYLHNISDKGFNYSNVAIFLPDDQGNFTVKHYLKDNKLYANRVDLAEIDEFIKLAKEKRGSLTSVDQRKVAVPMINHCGTLKAILVAGKEQGFLDEDLELLDVYVQQTIATIENIILNERLLHYQDLLGKRLDQFVLLHYLAKEINEGIDYYEILKKYLQALQSPVGFNFKASRLYILDGDSVQRAFLADGELILEAAGAQEPLIAETVAKKSGTLSTDNTVFALPLLSRRKVSAVIEIVNDKEINSDQMQILEILAMQTSSVLDNARLRMNLEYMSFHDALTDLYNRAFFEKQLRYLQAKKNTSVGMIMCDVNELKHVNDTVGHHAGDALIIAAAGAIKNAVGSNATAARIGGDEFAILVSPCVEADLTGICAAIRDNMQNFNNSEFPLPLNMAMGWATAPDSADMDELFRCADRNMYAEKKKGSRQKT